MLNYLLYSGFIVIGISFQVFLLYFVNVIY